MADSLYWGAIDAQGDWQANGGMAQAIENAMGAVITIPPGADKVTRRLALIALAQGIIQYLSAHADAIQVTDSVDGSAAAVNIQTGP